MSNAGARWSPEQDEWLLKAVHKKSKVYCASALERSASSVQSRLLLLASRLLEQGTTLEAAAEQCKVTPRALEEFIEKQLSKKKHVATNVAIETDIPTPPEVIPPKTKKSTTFFYAVKKGTQPGIYSTWEECKAQIGRYPYVGSFFKKFATLEEATQFMKNTPEAIPTAPPKLTSLPTFISSLPLSPEQSQAVEKVLQGKPVFLTGAAGCGKTQTIKAITEALSYRNIPYGLTASTGSAAVLIEGKTLHSFLGIGLGDKEPGYYLESIQPKKKRILKHMQVLIIDEISMISQELFEFISEYLILLRGVDRPFGGVQLVLCGDFYQLPPVKATFCFKSPLWQTLNPAFVELKYNFRQSTDNVLQEILQRIRYNAVTKADIATLSQCHSTTFPSHIKPTCIYPKNTMVDAINKDAYQHQLKKVKTAWTFPGADNKPLSICEGLQVMVNRNIDPDNNIVNGTRGVVQSVVGDTVYIKLVNGKTYPVKQICFENFCYMPLSLAYAITVHKSQGVTLDAAEIDLGSDIFEYGQAYTALSRVRSLEAVRIVGVEKRSFRNHPEVVEFYNSNHS